MQVVGLYKLLICATVNGGGVVVGGGKDQQLGAGWFATGSQSPVEVCP